MKKLFEKRVSSAVQTIWIEQNFNDGAAAKKILEEAAAGEDGDACYFLGRCYLGECFVNPAFGFPEDDELGYEYFNKSLEYGSAAGMFGSMRAAGFEPKRGTYVYPPYVSLREIWAVINEMAENGELFCQYMIATAYYFGDVIKFLEYDPESIDLAQVQYWKNIAASMYEKCIEQGMGMAIQNLINILTSGDYGMPKQEERARLFRHIGADMHMGVYELETGREYEDSEPEKARELYERAILHGEPGAYYYLGELYSFRGKLPRDLNKAKECYEMGLKKGANITGCITGCSNCLGEIYFYGGQGIAPDYEKAVQYFLAVRENNDWASDMLGTCYLKGLGTPTDYASAKKEFEIYTNEALSAIGLGEIYAYGLGVTQDIKKGMEYWDKFPMHPRVIENKKNFKKTLFGWKQR